MGKNIKSLKWFKFIDLFAGIWGIRLGFEPLGATCVFTSEFDLNVQKTYEKNFWEKPQGDITKIKEKNIPSHDILLGWFPCQAFSIAGHRKGFEDTRWTLFFDVARIIKYHKPKAFLLENVKGLINHDKGNTFKIILDVLNQLWYKVYYKVLNSMDYANIPQNRERVIIVGFHKKKVKSYNAFEFPEKIPLSVKINDMLDNDRKDQKYYYSKEHPYYKELDRAIKSKGIIYQWRRHYVRENKSKVCPTLTANMGTWGHNVPLIRDKFWIRKLTPRECLRFQWYPDTYKFADLADSKLYYQVGNSVTVPLMKRVAEKMSEVL